MTTKRNKPGPDDPFAEISQRLDGLLGTLGETLGSALGSLDQAIDSDVVREHTIDTPNGPLQARAGVRVRMGGLGRGSSPVAPRPKPDRTAPPKDAYRSVVAEVFDDNGIWCLTAEMPGVSKSDLVLTQEGRSIVLRADGARAYRMTCELPEAVDLADLSLSVINGIVELRADAQNG